MLDQLYPFLIHEACMLHGFVAHSFLPCVPFIHHLQRVSNYKGGNLNTQSSDTPIGNADSGLTSSDMTYSAGHVAHALISKHKDLLQNSCFCLSVFILTCGKFLL